MIMKTSFDKENRKTGISCFLAFLVLTLVALPSRAITPWYLKLANATNGTGAQSLTATLLTPPTSSDSPFTVNGTNLIFGGNSTSNFTFTLDSSGFVSNALYAGTYQFILPNYNAMFIVQIPDTTNYQSLTLYVTNLPVFSGIALSSYGLITNLLGFDPARSANTNDFARTSVTNDFARAANTNDFVRTSVTNDFARAANTNDFVRTGVTNDFARAANTNDFVRTSVTNDFARAANTNDFARITADGLSQSISNLTSARVITNGAGGLIVYKTNGVPGSAFTNFPQGFILVTTNGSPYVLSNAAWHPITIQ
jgi:hypothetical protein